MRKTFKRIVLFLAVALVAVAIALPFAVPPLVERLISEQIAAFGLEPDVVMYLHPAWRNGPGLAGSLRIAVRSTPWCVEAKFGASCCEWSATVKMEETPFSEHDHLVEALLTKYPVHAVSNLVISGKVALHAQVERTFRKPLPVWRVKLPMADISAGFTLEDRPYSIDGLFLTPGASGIDDHYDISPLFVRAKVIDANGIVCSNTFATVRASEKAMMINEASADFCGGKVRLYSVFLDPQSLNAGFTMFLDDIDAGQALQNLKGFQGDASGRLHGKTRLFIRQGGKAIHLSDTFLYSTPGEIGKLRMVNPELVTDNLALTGVGEDTLSNVANALTDLDYSALRLTLTRVKGNEATLSAHINGTATRGKRTVPVNLTVNFHGELEQLVNQGLGLSAKLKGKRK